MTTPHPHADILRAIADGKPIEARCTTERATKDRDRDWIIPADVLGMIADPVVLRNWELRIKPETITINGYEVPCPVQEPSPDVQYWCVDLHSKMRAHMHDLYGDETQDRCLKLGLVHHTREAAIAHADALLIFTRSDK